MPKLKLTQKIVEGLKGTEKLESYFDEALTGFGVYQSKAIAVACQVT
jgi:hypothetical protein